MSGCSKTSRAKQKSNIAKKRNGNNGWRKVTQHMPKRVYSRGMLTWRVSATNKAQAVEGRKFSASLCSEPAGLLLRRLEFGGPCQVGRRPQLLLGYLRPRGVCRRHCSVATAAARFVQVLWARSKSTSWFYDVLRKKERPIAIAVRYTWARW